MDVSNLDAALTSLKATLGDFDNIKLLLAGDDAMTREIVDADLLALAGKLAAGEIRSVENLGEAPLRDARIAF